MVLGNRHGGVNSGTIQVFAGVTSSQPTTSSNKYLLELNPLGGQLNIGTQSTESDKYIFYGNHVSTSDQCNRFYFDGRKANTDGAFAEINFRNSSDTGAKSSIITAGREGNNYGTNLKFYTTDTAGTLYERLTVNAAGNVGIGANNPINILDVRGGDGTASDTYATFGKAVYASAGWSGIRLGTPYTSAHDAYCSVIESYNNHSTDFNSELRFKTSSGDNAEAGERMRITSQGYVGIGTANPLSVLTVKSNYGGGTASGFCLDATDGPSVYNLRLSSYVQAASQVGYKFTVNNVASTVDALNFGYNGNVGIGTASPHAALHVESQAGTFSSAARAYFSSTDNPTTLVNYNTGNWGPASIYARRPIVTQEYFVSHAGTISASDVRIKKNIVDADDAECLETLRLLKPKKYQYVDGVERGEEPVWGFIAQEVRDTLPHATQLRNDILPNIYELANVSSSNVITFINFNTSNLESNASTLIRTKGIDGQDHDVHLVEVIDENSIRVEEDLSAWTGSVDAEGNVITQIETTTLTPEEYEALQDKSGYVANISGYQNANVVVSVEEYNALEDTTGYEEVVQDYTKTTTIYPGTQLFVYGQEVDDFIFVKKEAIWTVATSALQEVDRQQQADKLRITELETQLASVLARLDALESA